MDLVLLQLSPVLSQTILCCRIFCSRNTAQSSSTKHTKGASTPISSSDYCLVSSPSETRWEYLNVSNLREKKGVVSIKTSPFLLHLSAERYAYEAPDHVRYSAG